MRKVGTMNDEQITKKGETSIKRILRKHKVESFPTIPALLIAIGIAGVFIAMGIRPYVEAGREIINEIPEIEIYSDAGTIECHSTHDPLGRPQYAHVVAPDVNETAVIYVYWDTEVGWLRPWPAEKAQGVEAFIYDEENFRKYEKGDSAIHISYGEMALIGQMYGIAPHDGDYYIVFDNSKDTLKNVGFKTITYNIRAVIPSHTERVKEDVEGVSLGDAIAFPCYAMVIVGVIGVTWWGYHLNKGNKTNK